MSLQCPQCDEQQGSTKDVTADIPPLQLLEEDAALKNFRGSQDGVTTMKTFGMGLKAVVIACKCCSVPCDHSAAL